MARPLAELLQRFHDAVTAEAVPDHALELVRHDGVDPRRRLEVYCNAYWIRLIDALASEYPKITSALGRPRFVSLCRAYLAAHPTSRPSLRDAGEHLAAFLARGGFAGAPSYLADLARLERARTEAFDGPDAPALTRADLGALPPESIAFLRLPLVPTGDLLELGSIADEVWAAIEAETEPPAEPTEPVAARHVLVWRRDNLVIHRVLAPDEAQVLRALADGATFAEACEVLVDREDAAQRALEIILTALDGAAFAASGAKDLLVSALDAPAG